MKLSEVVGGIPPEKGGYGANTIAQQDANQMQGEPMGKPDVNSLAANKEKNDQKKQIQAQIKSTQLQLKQLKQQLVSIK